MAKVLVDNGVGNSDLLLYVVEIDDKDINECDILNIGKGDAHFLVLDIEPPEPKGVAHGVFAGKPVAQAVLLPDGAQLVQLKKWYRHCMSVYGCEYVISR